MSSVKPRMERGGVILSIVALAGIGVLAVGNVATDRPRTTDERPRRSEQRPEPMLSERLAAVDTAIARRDLGRAVHEWRDAYGVALSARRWDAMADVGDAAVRIDALAGHPRGYPTGFRAEARQAYLRALFLARHQRAPEGIERVAQAFAALGDTEMATRARSLEAARR